MGVDVANGSMADGYGTTTIGTKDTGTDIGSDGGDGGERTSIEGFLIRKHEFIILRLILVPIS